MVNFEKAVIAANFYEIHKEDKKLVTSYLQHTLSSIDAMLVQQDIVKELDSLQDIQDIMAYEKALQTNENAKPKRVEILINKLAVQDAFEMTIEKISTKPELIKNTMGLLSVIAYKYQLKYTYIMLNEMLADKQVWEDVTFH